MRLNADFSKRVAIQAAALEWAPSPITGVERRMLDRIGEEVARATSIVRYAPESQFLPHTHGGGEEFFVLEGVFSDEHGDFPAGSNIRNPPTSHHTPRSKPGCVIFVKLWQFDSSDRTQVRLDTKAMAFEPVVGRPGVEIIKLFADNVENARIERWKPNAHVQLPVPDGAEFLVLNGEFIEAGEQFKEQSWLRLPRGATMDAHAGSNGCEVWVKTDHLRGALMLPSTAVEN
jgi:ChrR Cupin-like domain